jgi:hypothetical protein
VLFWESVKEKGRGGRGGRRRRRRPLGSTEKKQRGWGGGGDFGISISFVAVVESIRPENNPEAEDEYCYRGGSPAQSRGWITSIAREQRFSDG